MNTLQKTLTFTVAFACGFPSFAFAEGFYAATQLGYSLQTENSQAIGNNIAKDVDFPGEFDSGNGNVVGLGLGYQFNSKFRLEARINRHDTDFNESQLGKGKRKGEQYLLSGSLTSITYTIEGFYDFDNSTRFTPYIKAGVGVADNSYSAKLGGTGVSAFDPFDGRVDGYYDGYADDDSTDLTWNVGLGVNYNMSKAVALYTEYQYIKFGTVQTKQDAFTDGFKIDNAASHQFLLGLKINI